MKTKFKDTEIGMIPEDWKVDKIENYLDKIIDYRGKTPKKSESGVITISAKSIKNGKIDYNQTYFISEETFKKWEVRGKPHVGDILLTTEGPLGEVASYDREDVAIAQRLITLRGKDGKLDNNFLKYYLMSHIGQHQLHLRATGTTVQGIKQSEFRKILILITTIKEQTSIAKILSDLDSKIELLQKQNKTLKAIGQATFKHWFVDFEFPDEEGKPYKSSGGEIVDSETGKIPKGWEVKNLGEFLNVIKGCSYKSEDLKESDKALITLKSINRGGGFNQKGYKEYVGDYKEEQIVKDGDIIVAQTDLTQAAEVIGTPAIVNSLNRYNELIVSLDLQILRIEEKLNKGFAYFLLKTAMFHNHALSYTNGTTVLHLNKNAVPDFKFTLPNENILDKFGKIAEQILEKGDKNEKEVYILSQIRDSLLPKLMSGEIRVKLKNLEIQK
ncbi:MAG: Type-1 restriction enzyme MjaXIP specificity protein [Candidatus Argoarchaeum ethanivorans]|uniref:Type-1 restriction enzyme MjaXIP specificity protein n=1 Tax=Candidatus Argoarchaeum ethanivorans TaxID=2608793 RepID=A0A811TIH2_9EURY|nr:MAG: Type-1 restriction enzyme MjaXIP specificity protein [Candidatus Argoarchaeum ethanivorans]